MSWKPNSSDFISDWIALGVSKQKSIERLAATACQDIMDKTSVEWIADVFRDRTLPFGSGTRSPETIPHLSLRRSTAARTIDHHPSAAHGASSDMATSMISDRSAQAWLTPWGIRAVFGRVDNLPHELHQSGFHCWSHSFCQGRVNVLHGRAAQVQTCQAARPTVLMGHLMQSQHLGKCLDFIRVDKSLPLTVQGDLVPHGWNRAVQSGHKRNS